MGLDKENKEPMDLMIVMGTSLAVMPFCFTITQGPETVPRVLINLENTSEAGYDFDDLYDNPERLFLKGTADATIRRICKDVGWEADLDKLIKSCESKYKKTQLTAPEKKDVKRKTTGSGSRSPGSKKQATVTKKK